MRGQTCIVHLIRRRLEFASWKERKPLAVALRPIYTAPSADAAAAVAARLAAGDPVLRLSAGRPPDPLHHQRARERVRPAPKDHQDPRALPHDDAATKLFWLALRNTTARWTLPVREWKAAMHQFAILYEDRFLREDA
jgi:putative transposase